LNIEIHHKSFVAFAVKKYQVLNKIM